MREIPTSVRKLGLNRTASMIDASPAARKPDRRPGGAQYRVRPQRTAAVADDVDGDRRDARVRERGSDRPRSAVLAVAEPVAEDRRGPAARRRRARREEERE